MRDQCKCCSVCDCQLEKPYDQINLCISCAKKEIRAIKKYFISSAIGGTIFFGIIFLAILFIKMKYMEHEVEYIVYSPGFFVNTNDVLRVIAHSSVRTQWIIGGLCFMVPFGHYVKIDLGGDGLIAVSVILIELFISIISGPFYILANAYKIRKLSRVMRGEWND